MFVQDLQYQCQIEHQTSKLGVSQFQMILSSNTIIISKHDQPRKNFKSFNLDSDQTRIAWNYQNGLLSGFIINYLSTKKKKIKQALFFGQQGLGRLKQLLDGRVCYYQFYTQFEILSTISKRNHTEIVKCTNKRNAEIKIAKITNINSNEILIMQKLKRHPHKYLLSAEEIYREENQIIFLMDYCEGGTLFNYFANLDFEIPKEIVQKIMRKILKGVHHLHEQGITHRDLKFDNIMLKNVNDIDSLKIIDFGLSTDSVSNVKCGTPGYIAPEILNDQPYNHLCDIYSLGCLFHSLLSGERVFPASVEKNTLIQLNKENKYKISRKIQCPCAIDLIHKMLAPQNLRLSALDCLGHPYLNNQCSLQFRVKKMHFPVRKNPFKHEVCV